MVVEQTKSLRWEGYLIVLVDFLVGREEGGGETEGVEVWEESEDVGDKIMEELGEEIDWGEYNGEGVW